MSRLQLFLSNVFDIPITDDFIKQFVNNKNLDIDKVLKHPLLFTNMIYYYVWKYAYGTFPTKKDFAKFVKDHNINIVGEEPDTDHKLKEKVINSFFPLKVGFLKTLDIPKFVTFVNTLVYARKNDLEFAKTFLIDKWNYHSQTKETFVNNIFSTFLAINKAHEPPTCWNPESYKKNLFTGTYIELLSFDEWDDAYMTPYEKIQYTFYSDTNFFYKCNENAAIFIEKSVKNMHSYVYEGIKNTFEKHFNKVPFLIVDDPESEFKKLHDPYFIITIPDKCHFMLPIMFKTFLTISGDIFPSYRPLCKKGSQCLFYHFSYKQGIPRKNKKEMEKSEEKENTLELTSYGRILVSKQCHLSFYPDKNVYIVPPMYEDSNHNPHSFVHRKFIIESNLYYANKLQIDKFCTDNTIQCSLHRTNTSQRRLSNNSFKGDFVIDFDGVIDPKEYSYNGVISVLRDKHEAIHVLINGIYVDSLDTALNSILKFYESPHLVKQFKINAKSMHALYNKEYVCSIWKEHLKLECPYTSEGNMAMALNNILLLPNFVNGYFEKYAEKINCIKTNCTSEYQVVLLDNRETPMSVISVIMTLSNLKKEYWGCKVFTSSKCMAYYQKYLENMAEIIYLEELDDISTFHIDIYNDILKSSKFWKSLRAKKCLIIQNDGFIVREGAEEFLKFDYVGAPWANGSGNEYLRDHVNVDMVGNGGLSLRSVPKMIEIAEKYVEEKRLLFFHNINYIPEDVYFCKYLKKIDNVLLPDTATANLFSSEETCNSKSLGIHRLWSYHNTDVLAMYFKTILE